MTEPANNVPEWATNATWSTGDYTTLAPRGAPTLAESRNGLVGGQTVFARHLNYAIGVALDWIGYYHDDVNLAVYGDASDGDLSLGPGAVETLTRDMHYATVTLEGDAEIRTNGFRLHAHNLRIPSGTARVTANGANGAGISGGAAAATGSVRGGESGGSGQPLQGDDGIAGGSISDAIGGRGGNGGDSNEAGGVGGTAQDATEPTPSRGTWRVLSAANGYMAGQGISAPAVRGGSGGASGGNGDTGTPGGGGAGGNVLCLFAHTIANEGSIEARGGDAAAPSAGDASGVGGSGGGGGGGVYVVCRRYSGAGTISAPGGLGSAGFGLGDDGDDGAPGSVFVFRA